MDAHLAEKKLIAFAIPLGRARVASDSLIFIGNSNVIYSGR